LEWPSFNDFKNSLSKVENSLSIVQIKLGEGFEKFRDRHPIIYHVIKKAVPLMPYPVKEIVSFMYEKYGNDKEGASEEIFSYLENVSNISEQNYEKISKQLLQINTNMAKEKTLLLVKDLLVSTGEEFNDKLSQLTSGQERILNEVKYVGNTVRGLYNEIENIQHKLGIEKDPHIKFGTGYKIYCPDNWQVVSKEETEKIFQMAMGQIQEKNILIDEHDTSKLDMVIRLKEKTQIYQQNVTMVMSDSKPEKFIEDINKSHLALIQMGWCIINQNIDELANIATIELMVEPKGEKLFQIQKHYLYNRKHYVLTMSDLKDSQLRNRPDIVEDIKIIVQSITFV